MLVGKEYTVFCDIISFLLAIILICFIKASIIDKSKGFKVLLTGDWLIMISAIFNICYHYLMENFQPENFLLIYFCRSIHYISLIIIFLCYNFYLDGLIDISKETKRRQRAFMLGSAIFYAFLILIGPLTKFGFHMENGQISLGYFLDPFTFAYMHFCLAMLIGLIKYRKHFSTKIFICIIEVMFLSIGTMLLQFAANNHSLTVITFLFPIILMFFLFHSSSYNYKTGTLNRDSCIFHINDLVKEDKKFNILFLELDKFYSSELFSKKVKKDLNVFLEKYFKNFFTFQLNDELFCLIYEEKKESDFSNFKNDFLHIYKEDKKVPFKIIDIKKEISSHFQTIESFEKFFYWKAKKIKDNTISFISISDIDTYFKEQEILLELEDINKKRNLEDERILVYCQPIYNVEEKGFKCAEILMRLKIKNKIIYPDSFIGLAEENGYIHALSLIILNKACTEMQKILKEGYDFSRISINFSVLELNEKFFCKEIKEIIQKSNLNGDKIAIELTESTQDKDYILIEKILNELKELNIKFYLDDFGTGYSNFERLMKLPIDVIKFDRSMLLMSNEDEDYKYMVNRFSEIFNNLDYQILFEGVESENDEDICLEMNAHYLQGYKYSKPIPFEQIRNFLTKKRINIK